MHVGDVLYASNEYELNSDIGSRAEARVLSGALRGSKLFGQFKLTGDYLVIEYSQLVLTDGTVLTVQAVAEDPVAERLFVRSSIDHHMVERWGGLLAGTYLATYGQKLEQSGATTVVTTGAAARPRCRSSRSTPHVRSTRSRSVAWAGRSPIRCAVSCRVRPRLH